MYIYIHIYIHPHTPTLHSSPHIHTHIHIHNIHTHPNRSLAQLTAECEQLMVKGLNALTSRHVPYEGKYINLKPIHVL